MPRKTDSSKDSLLHTKTTKLIKKLESGSLSDSSIYRRIEKLITQNEDALTIHDYLVLMERNDLPANASILIKDSFKVFYAGYLRKKDTVVKGAEKIAKKIEIDDEWLTDCRRLGLARIDVKTTKALRKSAKSIDKIQVRRDRIVEILNYLDSASAPLLDVYDEAVEHIKALELVRRMFTNESGRNSFAGTVLRVCTRKTKQIGRIKSSAKRSIKNLDNAYFSVKLAIDVKDNFMYRTSFTGKKRPKEM